DAVPGRGELQVQARDGGRLPGPLPRHQGAPREPGEGSSLGAVDRLLQARAPREVPEAARPVLAGHEGSRTREEVAGPGAGPEAPRPDRRDRQDLLGDEGRLI